MAMTHEAVSTATVEWKQRTRFRRSGSAFAVWTLSTVWIAVIAYWLVAFWTMLADAAPVLAMFEAENGGPLSADEWLQHNEAREIFCPHPNGDPSTNRIGRYITNADLAYGPVLAIGGMLAMGSAAFLMVSNTVSNTVPNRWMARLIALLLALTIVPIIIYSGEIGILTQVTE